MRFTNMVAVGALMAVLGGGQALLATNGFFGHDRRDDVRDDDRFNRGRISYQREHLRRNGLNSGIISTWVSVSRQKCRRSPLGNKDSPKLLEASLHLAIPELQPVAQLYNWFLSSWLH